MVKTQYKIQWQFCRSPKFHTWNDMPEETSKLCEAALNSGRTSCVFNSPTHRIEFNLQTREQMSTDWGHVRTVRKIRRVLIALQGATGSQPTGSQPTGYWPDLHAVPTETPGTGSQGITSSPPVEQSSTADCSQPAEAEWKAIQIEPDTQNC